MVSGATSLNLVRDELFATMEEAESSLEHFIADRHNGSLLQQAVENLHQVRGALNLIELAGAELLAKEVLEQATDIPAGAGEERDVQLSALSNALHVLRRYLESIDAHRQEMPELLLPAINDLRQAGTQPPLPGNFFFRVRPDHAPPAPSAPPTPAPPAGKLLLRRAPGSPPPGHKRRTDPGCPGSACRSPAAAADVPGRTPGLYSRTESSSQSETHGAGAEPPGWPVRPGRPWPAVLDRRGRAGSAGRWPVIGAQVAQATVLAYRPGTQAVAGQPSVRSAAQPAQGVAVSGGLGEQPWPVGYPHPRAVRPDGLAFYRSLAGRGIPASVGTGAGGNALAVVGHSRGVGQRQGHARPDRTRHSANRQPGHAARGVGQVEQDPGHGRAEFGR